MEKLNPKSKWIFFLQEFGLGLFVLIFGYAFLVQYLMIQQVRYRHSLAHLGISIILWGAIVFIAYIIFCYIWANLSYKSWKYELTDVAFRIERGVVWKKYVSIPYGRIQNVDIYRGVLDRMLGLSNLKIQTAGFGGNYTNPFGAAEGKLPGLSVQKAEELRDELIKRSQENKQGL